MKKILLLIIAITLFVGCSSLRLKTDHGWFGPDVYELTDGELSVRYYNGDCCCIAKEVLEELRNRVNSGKVDWQKFADKKFADEYLKQLCAEMLQESNATINQ